MNFERYNLLFQNNNGNNNNMELDEENKDIQIFDEKYIIK